MSELIKHFTDDSFDQEIKEGVTLVDFHADWCGPCRMLARILEQVAQDQDVIAKASIGKINIDNEHKTASQFQITSVPTLILFQDGKEVNRLVGLCDAKALKSFILSA